MQYRHFITIMKRSAKDSALHTLCRGSPSKIGLAHTPLMDINRSHFPSLEKTFSFLRVRQARLIHLHQHGQPLYISLYVLCHDYYSFIPTSLTWRLTNTLTEWRVELNLAQSALWTLYQGSWSSTKQSLLHPQSFPTLQANLLPSSLTHGGVDPRTNPVQCLRQICAVQFCKLFLHFQVPHQSSHASLKRYKYSPASDTETWTSCRQRLNTSFSWASISPPQGLSNYYTVLQKQSLTRHKERRWYISRSS